MKNGHVNQLEACPHCRERGIDTSRPTANFWRCGSCRMAIKRAPGGRLVLWLNPFGQPKTKRKTRR